MRPTIEMSDAHDGAGQSYSRIIVQIASGTDERSIQLMGQNFDAMMARTGRVTELSDWLCREDQTEESIQRMVRYLSTGARALAQRD